MKKILLVLVCTSLLLVQLDTKQTKKKVIATVPKTATIEQLKTQINNAAEIEFKCLD